MRILVERTICVYEVRGVTTFCEYKVVMTQLKRRFRRPYILGQFYNLSSGYIITNDTKFKTFTKCGEWAESVKERIERGEL